MSFRYFLSVLALLLCVSLHAQTTTDRVSNRAKNRAKNKTNQRIDQKVDKAVDDAFNSVGNLFKKKKKKNQNGDANGTANGNAGARVDDGGLAPNDGDAYQDDDEAMSALGNMFGGNKDFEPFTNETSFSMTMVMVQTKKNGKQEQSTIDITVVPTQIGTHISAQDGKEKTNVQTIFDTQTGKTTLISTDKQGNRSGTRMRMPQFNVDVSAEAQNELDNYDIVNTGQTSTVNGYNCTKWTATDRRNGQVTESWVTQDIDLDAMAIYSSMARMTGGKAINFSQNAPYEGVAVRSVMTEKNGTKVTIDYNDIRVGEANVNRAPLDTRGAQIQDLGF